MGLGLWKNREKLQENREFRAYFRRFLQKSNSGPPYPQKPHFPPLTLPSWLLKVCSRRVIHPSHGLRRQFAVAAKNRVVHNRS